MTEEFKNQYDPDTASHPGETLADILDKKGISPDDFEINSYEDGLYIPAQGIIDGKTEITPEIARLLNKHLGMSTGTSADFWINRQRVYDEWKKKNDS